MASQVQCSFERIIYFNSFQETPNWSLKYKFITSKHFIITKLRKNVDIKDNNNDVMFYVWRNAYMYKRWWIERQLIEWDEDKYGS